MKILLVNFWRLSIVLSTLLLGTNLTAANDHQLELTSRIVSISREFTETNSPTAVATKVAAQPEQGPIQGRLVDLRFTADKTSIHSVDANDADDYPTCTVTTYDQCTGNCDSCATPNCCPTCTPCCTPSYWIAGTEATFLSPDLNSGFVSYRIQDQFAAPAVDTTFGSNDNPIEDFYVAPRLWLGVQRGCWGLVGRYWHMQAAEASHDPFEFTASPTGPFDSGNFIHNRFEAYTADLEVTRNFCLHDTKNTFSFGARYASLLHDAALSVDAQINNGAGGAGVLSGNARSNRRASGAGITSSFTGRKPLFCNSCIHLYYGVRGSVVWGEILNSVETDTIEITAGAAAGSYNRATSIVDDAMFIGEAQLGFQADYSVMCFPADAFFRIAFEYQYWDAQQGSATANSFAGFGGPAPANLAQGTADAHAEGLTLDLIGLTVGTGFTW